MTKFDIVDRSEPAFHFSMAEPSTPSEGALGPISSDNSGDGVPSDTPLSVDAIISYCESQLRGLDSTIVHKMAEAGSGGDGHGGFGSDTQIGMLELQSHMSERQNAVQLTTQMLQDLDAATKSVIDNIGHDGAPTNSGESGGSSTDNHPPGWPFNTTAENGAASGNHAHLDALSTVHITDAHEVEPAHSFESSLDLSHLTAHL